MLMIELPKQQITKADIASSILEGLVTNNEALLGGS